MTRFDSATTAAAAFGCGILLIALTGCAQLGDVLHKQHREHFDTYEHAADAWVGVDMPDWIPRDSTEIRNLATTDETVSVIRVVTDSDLAGDCATAPRLGLPQLSADWAAEEWETLPAEVAVCGDYEIVATDDGWLGWFQASEPGQTPR